MSEAGDALKAKIEAAKQTVEALADEAAAAGGTLRDRVEDGLREAVDGLTEVAESIEDDDDVEDDEGVGA